MELPVGADVGGYVVRRRLGSGATGSVYLARHRSLPKDVALKVLTPAVAHSAEIRARFAREADLLSRLHHPGIAGVEDRGEADGLLWMTMRYVPGPDLETVLSERGALPPDEAVAVVEAVAAALDHAHENGLVHRDVKPANILLQREAGRDRAVLADFGIAKDLAGPATLTRTGQPVATLPYGSPEQVEGRPLDRRSDVYSLGTVLFELLSGRRAIQAEEPNAILYAVALGPVPDLRAVRPDLPEALAEVCARAMAKDPADRFPTCGELAAAARAAVSPQPRAPETTIGTPPAPPPPGAVAGPPLPDGTGPPRSREVPTRDPATPTGSRPGRRSRRRAAALVAAVTVVVVGVLVAVLTVRDTPPRDDPPAAQPSTTGTSTSVEDSAPTSGGPTSGSGGPTSGTAPAVGACLDDGGAVTSCAVAHAAEVVATGGDCDEAALLAYLGGVPGQDVLREVDLGARVVGDTPVCVVGVPAGSPAGSAQDALLDRAGDVWRLCYDQVGREVSCAEPHEQEVVAEGAAGETLDCRARASAYLDRPFDQFATQLRLPEDATRCVVEVRGDNVLTASLRRLGSTALPVEAD
ncbi:serine/threonine-protein kinase [Geodermatophilus bullaregiensis]|uniref:serine/threonine-protein kinase n=1 Tax=Geodermatophilus bullaregiensis TaxID=1564160 RepID=UPI001956C558|nr:serine/threonine-protein kinase [Geodermatophilus bullaregiensis]MBM7806401.1 serine/threonine-protein kinase [Geodermatophilus bullaregiensis]